MRECDSDWADVSAHTFAHTLQVSGEYKLRVVTKVMTRKTDKVDLDDEAVLDSQRFHSHRFIDDPTVAFIKRQRLAEGSCSGRDVEQLLPLREDWPAGRDAARRRYRPAHPPRIQGTLLVR